jgi:hypothetical protein
MPKIVKKYGKITLVLGLILVLVAMYLTIPTSQAATITSRKMTISDSRPSQTGVTYTFTGTHSSTVVKCLRVQYCTTATGTCTKPTGMVTTSATRGTFTGWTTASWTIVNTTDGETKYTNATGEAGGAGYVIQTGTITNPSTEAVAYARVTTYTNTDCATGSTDTGTVAYSIIGGVAVSATVAEYMTFTIGDSAIGFGTWSAGSTAVRWATADELGATAEPGAGAPSVLTLSSNATNGNSVTIRSIGSGSAAGLYDSVSTNVIDAAASSAVVAGTEGYGVYGKNAASLTIAEGFDNDTTGDTAVSTTAATFVSTTGAVSSGTVDLTIKAAIAATTQAGSYTDTLVLVATPTY